MAEQQKIIQHEPLRVPQGWGEPGRSFIIQIERILTDIYRRISNLISGKQNVIVCKSYRNMSITGGAVSGGIDYPEGCTMDSHVYLVQPVYMSHQIVGWSGMVQAQSGNINIYIRQGETVPADTEKVAFNLICIPV